tara:strand:- start:3844 stop:5040 length:1197 start_codon:yes stop_codon:yes gene_type:complete
MKKLIFVFFLLLPLVAAGTVDISLEQVSSSNKVQIDVYLTPVDEPVEIESYDIFFESDDLESKIFTFIDGDTPNKDTFFNSILQDDSGPFAYRIGEYPIYFYTGWVFSNVALQAKTLTGKKKIGSLYGQGTTGGTVTISVATDDTAQDALGTNLAEDLVGDVFHDFKSTPLTINVGKSTDENIVTAANSGGGGGGCRSNWRYGTWSKCNSSLQKSRSMTDIKQCSSPRVDVKSCKECEISWVCSLWNECKNGNQQRTCWDESNCGVLRLKPKEAKNCPGPDPEPEPARIDQTSTPPTLQQPSKPINYTLFAMIAGVIILIALITWLIIYLIKRRKAPPLHPAQHQQLTGWIKQQHQAGVPEETYRGALKQKGWHPDHIDQGVEHVQSNQPVQTGPPAQ